MFRKIRWFMLVSSVFSLSACERLPEMTITTLEYRSIRAKVLSINPPKHFAIEVQDVKTGTRYQYRSKHCNAYRKYTVGETASMVVHVYEVERDGIRNLREALTNVC